MSVVAYLGRWVLLTFRDPELHLIALGLLLIVVEYVLGCVIV